MVLKSTSRTVRVSKPIGRAGDWFAKWEGESLPCVHASCIKGTHYHDPFDEPCADSKFQRYVDGLRAGKVLVTKTRPHPIEGHPQRQKYIALWTAKNVVVGRTGEQSVDFELEDRLVDFV